MDVKLHHCFLIVDDHEKALAFYRSVGATRYIRQAENLLVAAS